MSVKVANPIIVDESSLSSIEIAEPDLSIGEEEWYLIKEIDVPKSVTATNLTVSGRGDQIIVTTGNEVLVSNDGGDTFSLANSTGGVFSSIDKLDSSIMHYCIGGSVYRSTDGGATFSDITPATGTFLSVKSRGDVIVVCGTTTYISLDSGDTWTSFAYYTTDSDITQTYIVLMDHDANGIAYYSRVNSLSFSSVTLRSGWTGSYGTWYIAGYKNSFVAGWANDNLSESDSGLYYSSNGGKSWTNITTWAINRVGTIGVSPSGYFVVSWYNVQGFAYSTDLGLTWTKVEVEGINERAVVDVDDDFVYLMNRDTSTTLYARRLWKVGDEAVVSSEHMVYQCLSAFADDDPVSGATNLDGETWAESRPTNKWALFDQKTTTPTVSASDFSLVIDQPYYFNTIALFECSGLESVSIEVKRQSGEVFYDEEVSLLDVTAIYDYYTFFFYRNAYKFEIAVDDIPTFANSILTITFHGTDISVGNLVFGFAAEVGQCLKDTQSEALDYSTSDYDTFGNLTYVERPLVQLNTYEILSDKSTYQYIQNTLKKVRSVNSLWIGDIGGGQKLITYGRSERAPMPFNMINDVRWSITVRGSI